MKLFAILSLYFLNNCLNAAFAVSFPVGKITQENGQICVSSLGQPQSQDCFTLEEAPLLEGVLNADSKFSTVRVSKLGLRLSSETFKTHTFIEVIWKGHSAGMLSISGPEGTLIVKGSVVPNLAHSDRVSILVDSYGDSRMTEEMGRGLVLGESGEALDKATLEWLSQAVLPVVEDYLSQKTRIPLP